jgi:hypothetical protein
VQGTSEPPSKEGKAHLSNNRRSRALGVYSSRVVWRDAPNRLDRLQHCRLVPHSRSGRFRAPRPVCPQADRRPRDGRFPALDRNGHGGDGRGEAGEDEEMGLGAYLSWLVKKRLDGRFDNSRDWT